MGDGRTPLRGSHLCIHPDYEQDQITKPGTRGGGQVSETDDIVCLWCVCAQDVVCMCTMPALNHNLFPSDCPLVYPQVTFTCVRWRH